ncbi:MAG: FliH/SctL family protein [Lachnospiraceae bacterium]|nr:FliH/SctL family protein [Lachnospiraceae bacterium]
MILLHNAGNITIDSYDFKDSFYEKGEAKIGDDGEVFENFNEKEAEHNCGGNEAEENQSEEPEITEAQRLEQEEREQAEARIEEMLAQTKAQTEKMLQKAEEEAEEIKKQAYSDGFEQGLGEGFEKAHEEHKQELKEETAAFLITFRDLIQAFEKEKDALIDQNVDTLKDISVAVAEKVIQVGLKSSGEIIKKMIVSATEKLKRKEWVKIYISKADASMFVEANTDLAKALVHLSDNLKIVAMENGAPGTCIIELPDQIIDASANTQLENIRSILRGARGYGGNDDV